MTTPEWNGMALRTALLLIAHGSRRKEANDELFELATLLRERTPYFHIQPSFLELAEPSIEQGGRLCVERGAEHVILLPYFLSPGKHVSEDLAEARERLARRFVEVRFTLADSLGRHPLLLEIIVQRAQEAEARGGHPPAQ